MKNYSDNDVIYEFTNALANAGIPIRDRIIPDGQLHRFKPVGDKHGTSGWYRLFTDGLPAASFGCWRRGFSQTWCIKSESDITPAELSAHKQRLDELAVIRESEDNHRRKIAQQAAQNRFQNAQPVEFHTYLDRKNVKSYGLRIEGGALLVPMRDVWGEICSLQTITAAAVDNKRFLSGGRKAGCFHLIGNEPVKDGYGQTVILGEGYATCAVAFEALDKQITVVVAFDAGNLKTVALELRQRWAKLRILIAGDNDAFKENNTGKEKSQQTAYALIGGVAWCIPDFTTVTQFEIQKAHLMSQDSGEDWGSAKSEKRKRQISKLTAERLAEYNQRKPTDFNDMATWLGVARVQFQLQQAIDRISQITVEGGKLPQILKQIENEMLFYGGNVYQRAGSLVRPVHEENTNDENGVSIPANALVIHSIGGAWLTKHFTTVAKWRKYDKRFKCYETIDAESKYAEIYLASVGEWHLPPLRGVVECPTLRRDGSLILESGYDKASGLYVDYRGERVHVTHNPTRNDALAALEILKQPLKDFSFLAEIDRTVILAAMLTAVVRRSLPTAPLFAIDAPIMGSGKSLLSDIVAMVATGRKAIVVSQGRDEGEDEKRFGSLLMRGVPLLNLDNIERPVSGEMLCSILTQQQVSARVLGQSKIVDLPTDVMMLATGNNLIFKGDMVRRVLLCQLDPQCERPDARKFDVDLDKWIPANRHKLLGAALTVLRAYIVAGKPKQDITAYGSFDDWNNLIRASLVWLSVSDPLETRQRLESSDPIKQSLGSVLALWHSAFGEHGKTAAEVAHDYDLNANLKQALMDVAISKRGDSIDPKRLGQWIKRFEKRVESGFRFEKAGEDGHSKVIYWKVANFAKTAGIAGIDSYPPREKGNHYSSAIDTDIDGKRYPQYPQNSQIVDLDIEEF